MYQDCINIAEEYQELYERQKRALMSAESERERLTREMAALTRRAAMYEEVSRSGIPDIVAAWMDDKIEQVLKSSVPMDGAGAR